jgi:5-methylthioribose kinase
MNLKEENVVYYLLERGLVSTEVVVNGDFLIIPEKTRNNLFKVVTSSKNLFIKQSEYFDAASTHILHREACAYEFIFSNPDFSKLASSQPEFFSFDKERNILVTEYITNTIDTHRYFLHNRSFPVEISARQAQILAGYHSQPITHVDTSKFPRLIPWALQLTDHPADALFPGNPVNAELIRLIQQNAVLKELLLQLKNEWDFKSFIHGDIKWVNFILHTSNPQQLHLIDWELADIGDPCWDVGGIFQSYLSAWIFGFDNNDPESFTLPESMAPFDIETMRPSIHSFWKSYSEALKPGEIDGVLTKSVRYAAARLIQTAIEGVVYNPKIYANSIRSLQVAFNILKSPQRAIAELFCINV